MKKGNLMMIALWATAAGSLQAGQEVATAKTEVVAATLSPEERAFAAKLSERTQKIFTQMTAEQRKAVMAVATDPALNADGAVDKVVKSTAAATSKVEARK